jgi:hypothetical protein
MKNLRRALLFAAALALTALIAGTGATAGAAGGVAKKSCHLTPHQQRHMGASYVTSLSVQGTSCAKGRKVTKAFHKCRHQNGGADGHCHSSVMGFSCSEDRYDVLQGVQYSSHVTCKDGGKRVKSTYTQNT